MFAICFDKQGSFLTDFYVQLHQALAHARAHVFFSRFLSQSFMQTLTQRTGLDEETDTHICQPKITNAC